MIPVAVEKVRKLLKQLLPLMLAIYEANLIAKNNLETIPALSTRYPINKNKGQLLKQCYPLQYKCFERIIEKFCYLERCSILVGSK